MNHRLTASTMLAVMALVVGACAPSGTSTIPVSSPELAAPSAGSFTAAPSPKLGALPEAVRHRWVRQPKEIAGLTEPPIAAMLELASTHLKFVSSVPRTGPITETLASTVGIDTAGSVEVELTADGNGCHHGDTGTYSFALSASGLGLTVQETADACAVRADAIAGDWIRSSCPTNPKQACLGDLDPGRHVSINYLPFGKWSEWEFDYGRFGYTVPGGWTNFEDNADGFVLGPRNGPDGAGIFLFTDPRAHSQAKGCPATFDPAVGPSARALTEWIRSLPGLVVRDVEPIEIGGLPGTQLDLGVVRSRPVTCDWGEQTGVSLFSNASHDDFDWGIANMGRMRLFVLRLEPERALVIDIEAQDDATWHALLPDAMPIVESFSFEH